MTNGKIIKLVRSFGSTWGRIKPDGEAREVFFSAQTLADPLSYPDLSLGQDVSFDEEPDRANGTHAVQVKISATATSKN